MSQRPSTVFIGLTRDCAHSLPRILDWLEAFSGNLADWGYVFLENGSDDDTLSILRAFDEKHRKGIVETLPGLEKTMPIRTERLAWLRNRALDHVWDDERMSGFDHAIVMDMDGVNETFPEEALLGHMKAWPRDRGAVFANQSENYYDIWAFRHPELSPDDCWEKVEQRPAGMSKTEAYETFVLPLKTPMPRDSGLVEVDSAFGGLALYGLPAIRGCRYLGLDAQGYKRCEHVEFHRQIREKGYRLFIDTAMLTGSGLAEHKAPKSKRYWRRLLRKAGALAGRR